MKIHEYQARDLLSSYGIPVPAGEVITTADQATQAYKAIAATQESTLAVVKAQVFAGGRGKAGFVKLVNSAEEAHTKPPSSCSPTRWSPSRPGPRGSM